MAKIMRTPLVAEHTGVTPVIRVGCKEFFQFERGDQHFSNLSFTATRLKRTVEM